ncbi:MAG: rRNA maturation RNase YbeY [Candidatus Omnitrophica bacterium CG12_big_fil_rev_8_21_14_0_65_43_15]|uniref:Endoribonuclease YbeY n=1 Tax=Candidatus Taenaricola geysiri TaxID=1974752 RepID=A0A2J0LDG7_9BACT|nr:MAG: rRNA maturation RNase YbeY [Candidatus Omnitrophica bacterium CG1_02_43_210]PIR65981.1 MAG: rRNA maturation RNase YbeY [Candidatus Omnitrophica bacterium CG10_big_fil_rev_8_21_14_0_10_43_8]PIV12019.1 MAG: rRNA maturation RNase YbeY [Candidatus Omnitrophica bacterium CG03_land_8_20_14_0_80_43_22]PIW65908.1 MAG: rRNA maturation RNase YbeY [Candidatus Omnitrophica bacterium CG12_big_fil_rev_8_21_14_0_65_43_15]PIW79680.1 MAG: rRNA maturation RNase YbeY [Candidatus Omnitrophica bacterium CG_
MNISIINSQKKINVDTDTLRHCAAVTLEFLREKADMLSVYVVDDLEIRNLNYKYRYIDKPTDVLAFSMREGRQLKGGEGILGDVVISAETAAKQARRYKKDIKEEMCLYLAHGILHLVGYNDATSKQRKKMDKAQRLILSRINRDSK